MSASETLTHDHVQGRLVGRSIPRKEDQELLTGEATYVGDIVLPSMLHAVFYRSPYAHARLLRVDLSEVRRLPGVVLALAGDDRPARLGAARDLFEVGDPALAFLAHGVVVRQPNDQVADAVADLQGEVRGGGADELVNVGNRRFAAQPVGSLELAHGPKS